MRPLEPQRSVGTDPPQARGAEPSSGGGPFHSHRAMLLGLAYRMLGELARAEDILQDAWVRWQGKRADVADPRAYLVKMVARLCLNELDSARVRKEESRSDRLPEPINLEDGGIAQVEALDQISMAFLVLLQRLSPAERAALLLHEVFDFDHDEIAELLGKSAPACRKLLERARDHVASERRALTVSEEAHRRLLRAFLKAAASGDAGEVARLLAEDVVLIADTGPDGGSYGGVRNLPGPLEGARKVAAFVAAVAPRGAVGLVPRECSLNGNPAILVLRGGQPYTAILISVADDRIRGIFMQADPARLRHLGAVTSAPPVHLT